MNDEYLDKVETAEKETQCSDCIHVDICFFMIAENDSCNKLNYSLMCKYYQKG